jgi:hypothetical protein
MIMGESADTMNFRGKKYWRYELKLNQWKEIRYLIGPMGDFCN